MSEKKINTKPNIFENETDEKEFYHQMTEDAKEQGYEIKFTYPLYGSAQSQQLLSESKNISQLVTMGSNRHIRLFDVVFSKHVSRNMEFPNVGSAVCTAT